ncbi:MAG: 5'-methylthioadenosine/adenosylhomocysteine nucleosidase [Planctomycetota bacterium]
MRSKVFQLREKPIRPRIEIVAFVCLSATLLCASCSPQLLGTDSGATTAILGAFKQEVAMLEQELEDREERRIEGIRFVTGKLGGRQAVVVWTGIGKVNAAMTSTLLIERFRPEEIIFTGIAGAIDPQLLPGDVIIATKTAQHDLGTITAKGLKNEGALSPVTGRPNPVFLPTDQGLVKLAEQAALQVSLEKIGTAGGVRKPKIIKGVIVTGDVFAASTDKRLELRNRLEADAVEMEGAAVAQVCYQLAVPYLVIRGISDSADDKSFDDLDKYLDIAARNSQMVVSELVGLINSEKAPCVSKRGQQPHN